MLLKQKTCIVATSFLVGLSAYATQAENSMHNHRTNFIQSQFNHTLKTKHPAQETSCIRRLLRVRLKSNYSSSLTLLSLICKMTLVDYLRSVVQTSVLNGPVVSSKLSHSNSVLYCTLDDQRSLRGFLIIDLTIGADEHFSSHNSTLTQNTPITLYTYPKVSGYFTGQQKRIQIFSIILEYICNPFYKRHSYCVIYNAFLISSTLYTAIINCGHSLH